MQAPANPPVTVIIATLNRDRPLCVTLEYFLLREKYRPFEVIVIDQSDRHDQATTEFLAKIADRINYVRAPYKSLTRARNHGVRLASGQIIIFVDDDTEPFMGFIAGHVAAYVSDRVWMVTGPALSPGQKLLSRDELEKTQYERVVAGEELCPQAGFDYAPCCWALGCNLSARRSALDRVGGFDESIIGGATGDDADISHRIKLAGGIISYSAAAALIHREWPNGGARSVSSGYVYAYASNTNYFWRKLGAGWRELLRQNFAAYRKLILNQRMLDDRSLRKVYLLHRAFVAGAVRGLRQPVSLKG